MAPSQVSAHSTQHSRVSALGPPPIKNVRHCSPQNSSGLTAKASGLTPLSIIPTHVARVSLSSCVFSNWDISNKTVNERSAFHAKRASSNPPSSVCWAAAVRSDSGVDIEGRARFPRSSMAPSATIKKDKIFHPSSRKAGQLATTALRRAKLGNLASKRTQKQNSLSRSPLSDDPHLILTIVSQHLPLFLLCPPRRRNPLSSRTAPYCSRYLVNKVR